jgi:hypothetical protein
LTVPLKESARRRPIFAGGRWITLPDGDAWAFYEPVARTREATDPAGRRVSVEGWTFGEGVPPDIDAILSAKFFRVAQKASAATTVEDQAAALLEASCLLLGRNYEITRDEFETLIGGCARGDEASQKSLGQSLRSLVALAVMRAVALKEVA